MTHPDDEGFLARWSRRKRATADAKPVSIEPAPTAVADDSGDAEPDAVETGDAVAVTARDGDNGRKMLKRVLTEADFADVDFTALDFKSDYTRFMQQGVPDQVRNKALRQLWASDPIMANMDGLHDYWDDYTDAAVAVPAGTLKTAYRIGKGFLSDAEVAEWDALGKPAPADTAVAAAAPASSPADDEAGGDVGRAVSTSEVTAQAADAMLDETQPVGRCDAAIPAASRAVADEALSGPPSNRPEPPA